MKRSKFSEEQIVYAIRQAESGTPVGDLCRQLGVSDATFYAWKKKYAHLGVSELRRLRQLRDRRVGPGTEHLAAVAVDQVDGTAARAAKRPAGQPVAPFRGVSGGPQDGHRGGVEQRSQVARHGRRVCQSRRAPAAVNRLQPPAVRSHPVAEQA